MQWMGHVVRMDDGRILKDLLYNELLQGTWPTGRLHLRYKDIFKKDLRALRIDPNSDRLQWRQIVQNGLSNFEETFKKLS